jgi:gas vesicle protein
MRASTFFMGLTTGLAAGAVAVLFSTPQSGKELRTSVKTASTDWKEKLNDVKEKANDLKESINTLTLEAKEQLPETVDGLKKSLEKWQEETAPAQEHLQLEILAIQNSMEALEKAISKNRKKDKNKQDEEEVMKDTDNKNVTDASKYDK